MRFKLLTILFFLALAVPVLAGCEVEGGGDDLSSGSVNDTGEVPPEADPLPEGWDGIVRIHYRNDTANYMTKAIWVWGVGIDGYEYEFDNAGAPDDYGLYYDVDLQEAPWNRAAQSSVSFIIKERGTWAGQSADIVCTLNDYSSTLETDGAGRGMIHIWSWDLGNGNVDISWNRQDAMGDRIGSAKFIDWRTLHVEGTGVAEGRDESEVGVVTSYELYAYDDVWYKMNAAQKIPAKPTYKIAEGTPNSNSFDIVFDEDVPLYHDYILECRFAQNPDAVKQGGASFEALYDSEKFIEEYTYDGDDLGMSDVSVPEQDRFRFRVWAPTSGSVAIRAYVSGVPKSLGTEEHPGDDTSRLFYMDPVGHGVWETEMRGYYCDYFNFYTVAVSNGGTTVEAPDPYGISAGINGQRTALLYKEEYEATYPEGWDEELSKFRYVEGEEETRTSLEDLTIYEVHVRDFTADETWVSNEGNPRGTYKAFAEEGTTYNGVTTGIDHLEELGVDAVQILPFFDQDNDERTFTYKENGETKVQTPGYNWGYNPYNYNVVEGAYATDPYDPALRLLEFREMVLALAKKGIRTIMDVVYNHMSSVSGSSFEKVVPGYYFKKDENGAFIDETGVHNTFATNRLMASRFVVQSVSHWARDMGVMGFRFDLMGAIEWKTMRDAKDALYDIDPNIVVYGEPWRGSGGSTESQAGKEAVYQHLGENGKGSVGAFNDCGRNGLKGDTTWGSPAPSYGFMSQSAEYLSEDTMYNAAVVYLGEQREMTGKGIPTPTSQTLNYVSCHDNYTLYDQLKYTYDGGKDADTDKNVEKVSEAVLGTTAWVLLSQGAAFLHGGEEMLRTKVMEPDDPYWDKIEENDYVSLPGTENRLIRNSYSYGDAVNSFKWDRKALYKDFYEKYREAVHARRALIEEGYLAVSYEDVVQGEYQDGDRTIKVSRLWDDLISRGSYDGVTGLRPILAAQTEWSRIDSSKSDMYFFLGGRMNNSEMIDIGIGAGTLEVVYSTRRDAGTTMDVTNSLGIYGYEMLCVRRTR